MTHGNRPLVFVGSIQLRVLVLALLAVLLAALPGAQPTHAQAVVAVCDRTPEVEEAIVAYIRETRPGADCGNITMTELESITELTVRGYSSSTLNPSDFDDMGGLETLNIHHSPALTGVSANAFAGAPNIVTLDLRGNAIGTVHENAFSDLGSIETMDLGYNHIIGFFDGTFDQLSTLTTLTIESNDLFQIESDTLRGLSGLETLNLQNNGIERIHKDAFRHVPGLTELFLRRNNLSSLHEDTFNGLTKLDSLYLGENEITALHKDIFSGLTDLTLISVEENQISSLHEDIFDGLTSLDTLDLDDNNLSSLHGNILDGLMNLFSFSAGNNNLTALPDGLFGGTPYIGDIALHGNRISSLDSGTFAGLNFLLFLVLGDNELTTLPSDIFTDNYLLLSLVLHHNRISTLHQDTFKGLYGLDELHLDDNELTTLHKDLFDDLENLGTLHLHHNQLTTLHEETFDGLGYVGAINLDGNKLTSLHENLFDGLTTMTRLSMRDNNIGALHPDVFDALEALSDLYLEGNSLSSLPADVFHGPDASLVNLVLYGNNLTTLPRRIFHGFPRLERLHLGCNSLTGPFPLELLTRPRRTLRYLDLSGNEFRDSPTTSDPPTVAELKARFPNLARAYVDTTATECFWPWDGTLKAIDVSHGTIDFTPPTEFIEGEIGTNFTLTVDHDVDSLTIMPVTRDPNAVVLPLVPEDYDRFTRELTGPLHDNDPNTPGIQVGPPLHHYSGVKFGVRARGNYPSQRLPDTERFSLEYTIHLYREAEAGNPATPPNFVVTSEGGKITFNWDKVIKPKDAHEVRHRFYVRNPGDSDDDWVFLSTTGMFQGSTHESPHTEHRLPVGERYEFAMRAFATTRSYGPQTGETGSPRPGPLTTPVTHTVLGPNRPRDLWAERTVDGVGGPVRLTWQPPPLYPWIHNYLPSVMPVPNPNLDTSVVLYTISRAEAPADDMDPLTPLDQGAMYTQIDSVAGNVLTYTDTTAADDKAYFYRVVALSPDGPSDFSGYGFVYPKPESDDRTLDLQQVLNAPASPTNLAATAGSERIGLTWDEVADATSYVVFRRNPGEGYYIQTATTTATSYVDAAVVAGRTYGYVVKAANKYGSSPPSAAVEATILSSTLPPPVQPLSVEQAPAAPTGLRASVGDGSVTLSWTAPDDDTVTGYAVYREARDADPPEDAVLVTSVDAATTSATDSGVEAGAAYTYSVEALNSGGSSASVTVDVDIPAQHVGPLSEGGPTRLSLGPITGFTLVDASDQTVLATLTDSASVELADPDGGSYSIRADVNPGESIGSVRLVLSGATSVSRTENGAPYALYGDGGVNALNGEPLPAGSYTLRATAYSGANLEGDKLGTLEISFTVTQANRAPVFGSATYSFSIAEDAATGDAVGSVSATDADSDGITYTIEAGNGDGAFAIDGSSGALTTAAALDHGTTPSYTLTVQADDGNGGTATATVNVAVTKVTETGPLTGISLVDTSDHTVLTTLRDGGSVGLADPDGGSFGIRAEVDPNATIGSVRLELGGAKTVNRTEHVGPYSLYGDGGPGDLNGEALPAGSYTLTVTAYSARNRGGDELGRLEVSFTVTDAGPLAGFTLVDASDQSVLATLTDGGSVELADPGGGSFGILADLADGETVGSVQLELTGAKTVTRMENMSPYSLYGDRPGGNARQVNGQTLPAGSYTLTATAYADANLGGDVLGTLEVSFTITAAE